MLKEEKQGKLAIKCLRNKVEKLKEQMVTREQLLLKEKEEAVSTVRKFWRDKVRAGIPEQTLDYLDIQRCNFTLKTLTWMLLLLIGRQETGLPTLQPEVRFALPPQKLQPTIFKNSNN